MNLQQVEIPHPLSHPDRLVLPTPPATHHFTGDGFQYILGNQLAIGDTKDLMRKATFEYYLDQRTSSERTLLFIEGGGTQRWAEHGMQIVYPDPDLVAALIRTDVLDCVTASDVRGRSTSFLIVWPKATMVGVHDTAVASIVNIWNDDKMTMRIGGDKHTHRMPEHRFMTMQTAWAGGGVNNGCLSLSTRRDHTLADEVEEVLDPSCALQQRGDDHSFNGPLEGERVDDGRSMIKAILNLVLLMQSHPEYIEEIKIRQRMKVNGKKATKRTAHRIGRSIDAVSRVPLEPVKPDRKPPTGKTRSSHVRNAHWRRQRHGDAWAAANPDVIEVTMPDGGRAHMVWIEEMRINE